MAKQEFQPKIITIHDSQDGKDYPFAELARIQLEEGNFIALYPASEELCKINDNPLIMRLVEKDGGLHLQPIEDADLFEKVCLQLTQYLTETYEIPEEFTQ